jgi:predicted secreted Zn-dependent protease
LTPTTVPAATVSLPDRADCAAIRASDYRSEAERRWFLANCVSAALPTAGPSGAPLAAAAPPISALPCIKDVSLTFDVTRIYYAVAGTTLDELNASIIANGPRLEGRPVAGLMQPASSVTARRCVQLGSCGLGQTVITGHATITVPRLADGSALAPAVLAAVVDFVARVTLHEERHVIILQEGLEEAQRRLLAQGPMNDCEGLDHALDLLWAQVMHEISRRQDAFHVADAQGAGGTVVR